MIITIVIDDRHFGNEAQFVQEVFRRVNGREVNMLPLHDVGLAGLDAGGGGEVQRQCAIGGKVRCRGHFLDGSPVERMRFCGHLLSAYVERQAQGVPVAFLRQRAASELDIADAPFVLLYQFGVV